MSNGVVVFSLLLFVRAIFLISIEYNDSSANNHRLEMLNGKFHYEIFTLANRRLFTSVNKYICAVAATAFAGCCYLHTAIIIIRNVSIPKWLHNGTNQNETARRESERKRKNSLYHLEKIFDWNSSERRFSKQQQQRWKSNTKWNKFKRLLTIDSWMPLTIDFLIFLLFFVRCQKVRRSTLFSHFYPSGQVFVFLFTF